MPYDQYGRWYAGPENSVMQNPQFQSLPSGGMPMQLNQQQMQTNRDTYDAVTAYQQSLQNTTSDREIIGGPTTADPEKEKKQFNWQNAVAMGGGLISPLAQAIQPAKYDRRTGRQNKGTFNQLYGDSTFTKIGTSISPGFGTIVGAVVDRVKNAAMMSHEANLNRQALEAYRLNQGLNDQFQQPNYIGYAKKGMKSTGQLGNLEQDEIVIRLGSDGKYKKVLSTGPNHPSHQEGGRNYYLNDGDLVFPKKYKSKVEQALEAGNTSSIEDYKKQMLLESTAAALQGKEFSNQSGIEAQLQELSKGDNLPQPNIATAKYGAKINSNMKKKYQMGGMVGMNPYMSNQPMNMYQDMTAMSPQQELNALNFPNQVPAQKFQNGGIMMMPDMTDLSKFTGMEDDNTLNMPADVERMQMNDMPAIGNFMPATSDNMFGYGGMAKKYKMGGMVDSKDNDPIKIGAREVRYNKRDNKFLERQMKKAARRDAAIGKRAGLDPYNDQVTTRQDALRNEFVYPGNYTVYSQPVFGGYDYDSKRQSDTPYYDNIPFIATGDSENPNIYSQQFNKLGFPNFTVTDETVDFARLTPQQKKVGRTIARKGKMPQFRMGGMMKRADGSYSKRGLWDNMRAKQNRVGKKNMPSKSKGTVTDAAIKRSQKK